MTVVSLFLTATKLAGALVTLTVAANAFSFSRFRNKNLRRFSSPIDESSDTLADFNITEEENGFFFGLATAPAHVEDRLDDAWIQFAEQESVAGAEQKVDALMGSATADGGSQQAVSSPQRGIKGNKKSLKVAMEAMIRGFEKYMEVDGQEGEEEHVPNVTAWHNVPHP